VIVPTSFPAPQPDENELRSILVDEVGGMDPDTNGKEIEFTRNPEETLEKSLNRIEITKQLEGRIARESEVIARYFLSPSVIRNSSLNISDSSPTAVASPSSLSSFPSPCVPPSPSLSSPSLPLPPNSHSSSSHLTSHLLHREYCEQLITKELNEHVFIQSSPCSMYLLSWYFLYLGSIVVKNVK
jgi:hypothetical protein